MMQNALFAVGLRRLLTVALALVALAVTTPARADVLYGLSSSTPGTLYTINTATGAATSVTDLTGTSLTSLVDLAARNGVLYASDVLTGGVFSFGTINATTGAFTAINNQGGAANWQSLAYVPGSDLFYTVNLDNSATRPLLSVTPGGVISSIGNTNQPIEALTYDSVHGIMYGADASDLFTMNLATGAATVVGALGFGNGGRLGLAYDNQSNVLYLNSGDPNRSLYTVNVATGAATLVGSNGATAGTGIDGIAFLATAVPEPAPIVLAGLAGVLGLTVHALRRGRRSAGG